ncbi:MAG: helix-turn-helix transcriptional regulator [Actinomycetes bacterium]
MTENDLFWKDLEKDLGRTRFKKSFLLESIRTATIDEVVNTLDAARQRQEVSKSQLAQRVEVEPASVRRLFSSRNPNPTLGTLAEIAAALGMRIVLEELPKKKREQLVRALNPEIH